MVQELNHSESAGKPGRFGSAKKVIGLTGGFGSGKSTAARFFEEFGACVLNADTIAHETLRAGNRMFEHIASLFPEAVAEGGREIDRAKMAEIIFQDSLRRKQLENVVHPYVFDRIFEEVARTDKKAVILEVPLLYETEFDRYCSLNIVVSAARDKVLERLTKKGFDAEKIRSRQAAQLPLEEKVRRADLVIDNSQDLEETKRQVREIWNNLSTAAKGAS